MKFKKEFKKINMEMKKSNPYPAKVFPKIKVNVKNFENRKDALFGSFGRKVYKNCVEKYEKKILELLEIIKNDKGKNET